MRGTLILALTLFAGPACAASAKAPPPGAILRGANGTLEMSPAICSALGLSPSVPSAAYQPGIDAEGHPVAQADLPGSGGPGPVAVEIDGNLAGRLNLPPSTNATPILGFVVIRDNQAYVNGQPLNSEQQDALGSACENIGH